MKIAVIGAGLMGPAITKDCLEDQGVKEVLLIDIDAERLNKVAEELGNPAKLKTIVQDVTDREGLAKVLKGYDAVGVALLRPLNTNAIWGAIDAGVGVVELSEPRDEDVEAIVMGRLNSIIRYGLSHECLCLKQRV